MALSAGRDVLRIWAHRRRSFDEKETLIVETSLDRGPDQGLDLVRRAQAASARSSSTLVNRRPRWAIIGTGGIARTTVGDLQSTENLELIGVASRTPERAAAFAAHHGVGRAFESYDQVFDVDTVDVVYIATPISTHAEIARRALNSGKHVLVEKAFTTNAAEARHLANIAKDQRCFLMEAMWMRFNPVMVRMLDELAAGIIGEVRTVNAGFGIPLPPTFNIWRPELGGGALLDMGVYPITLAHLLLGVPHAVHAAGTMRSDGLDITDSVFLRYEGGRFAHALTSLHAFINPVACIGGTQGFIAFDRPFMSGGEFRVETPMAAQPRTVRVELEGNGYVPMFRAVSAAVTEGLLEHPLRPLQSTIDVLTTMDEIRVQIAQAHSMTAAAEEPEARTEAATGDVTG